MRSAIPKDKSNSAFCSAGIAARQSRNNLFCIMTLKFQRLHFHVCNHILFNGNDAILDVAKIILLLIVCSVLSE